MSANVYLPNIERGVSLQCCISSVRRLSGIAFNYTIADSHPYLVHPFPNLKAKVGIQTRTVNAKSFFQDPHGRALTILAMGSPVVSLVLDGIKIEFLCLSSPVADNRCVIQVTIRPTLFGVSKLDCEWVDR